MTFEKFHLTLLILLNIVHIVAYIYHRTLSKSNPKKILQFFAEIFFICLIGPFFPVFTALFFTLVLFNIYRYLNLKIESENEKKTLIVSIRIITFISPFFLVFTAIFFTLAFIGPLFPVFIAIFFTLVLFNIYRFLSLKIQSENEKKSLHVSIRIIAGFFAIIFHLACIFLSLVYIIAIVGRFWGLDVYYSISTICGILIALIIIYGKNIRDLSINFRQTNFQLKTSIVLIIILIVPVCVSFLFDLRTNQFQEIRPEIQIKTMSYNILYSGEDGTQNDWLERREYLSDYIEALDLDVFGLQEAFFVQLNYLNETLDNRNYTWYGLGREDGIHYGEHDAIFFDQDKYNLLTKGTFWFSETPDVPSTVLTEQFKRTCSWVHLKEKNSGGEFFFYNTHYGFYPEFHIKASIWLNKHIADNTGTLPVIVTGDFNMPTFFPFYFFLEDFGQKPLIEAYILTHNFDNPFDGTIASSRKIKSQSIRVDYIFVSQNIKVTSCEILRDSYDGIHAYSDHYPIVMECYFSNISHKEIKKLTSII